MAGVRVSIDLSGVTLNGHPFNTAGPLQPYVEALGDQPETKDAGDQPAPHGHRNNQFHLFHELGIYLTEHHAKRVIESVNIALEPMECPATPSRPFSGTLSIAGVEIKRGMTETDYPSSAAIKFESQLAGSWRSVGKGLPIYLSTIGLKLPGQRRRSRARSIVLVSVCF